MKKTTLLTVVILALLTFTACLNNEDDIPAIDYNNIAYGAVVNASPNASKLIYYNNDQLINSNALALGQVIGYFPMEVGENQIKVKTPESDFLDTLNFTTTNQSKYSFFAVNTEENLELLAFNDDFTTSTTNDIKLRFIQLSPDAPTMKVEFNDLVIGNFTFGSATQGFIDIPNGIYNIYLKNSETDELLATIENQKFLSNEVVTVFSTGFTTPPNDEGEGLTIKKYSHN